MNIETKIGSVSQGNEFIFLYNYFVKNNKSICYIARDEKEIPYMTTSIKADETVKMGIITDVKQELRKANALKIDIEMCGRP